MSEQPGAPAGGFEFNGPTVVGLLYLATYFTMFSALVGVILAYVWRRQPLPEWQQSQFTYLIRTFWLGLGGYALFVAVGASAVLAFNDGGKITDAMGIAGLVVCACVLLATTVLLVIRCALVIVNAQQRVPMANARSWTV